MQISDATRAWLIEGNAEASGTDVLMDGLWAVLHGMAALYLDRSAAFDVERAQDCVAKLLLGTRAGAETPPRIGQKAIAAFRKGSKTLRLPNENDK